MEHITELLHDLWGKDQITFEHSMRVGHLARCMAKQLQLTKTQTSQLILGCCLHDIGKLLIPTEILTKTTQLTTYEWDVMRQHPVLGAERLTGEQIGSRIVIDIVKYHHERWNGEGYPSGLMWDNIPPFARICTVIDAWDKMISDQPYRPAMTLEEAKAELIRCTNTQFDKKYVTACLRIPDEELARKEIDMLELLRDMGVKEEQHDNFNFISGDAKRISRRSYSTN
ncbi:HD-GYP domain-containing protein [Paenibacillus guangzhouensis]|uniref:HD-GYP domain-containing protein n=1 Tax=Paenibacillus guangzhouensis TaxID=1473112 RepID=UPI001D10E266|nr:HD domain-containing phosphohydrolase [Paenibacillus guangzhouensis]